MKNMTNTQLPILDTVPDMVYELTDAPENEAQADQYLSVLKGEIAKLDTQLSFRFCEFSDRVGNDPVRFQEWRAELQRRKMVKINQALLIRAWKHEYQASMRASRDQEKSGRREEFIKKLQNRIAKLKANIKTPEKTFEQCRRETTFLRAAIAEINQSVIEAMRTGKIDGNAISRLEYLHERLASTDGEARQVQTDLKMPVK